MIDAGKHNAAGDLIESRITRDPDDFAALYFLVRLLIDTNKPAVAHPIAEGLVRKHPDQAASWCSLGSVEAALQRPNEAIQALLKALEIQPGWVVPMRVLCAAYVMAHRFEEGKDLALGMLKHDNHHLPHIALATYYLHKREWAKGWKHYTHQLGRCKDRAGMDFGLPEWEGKGSVLIYAEQGLGDQLAYTSAIDNRCTQLVCHPKLGNLLKRSLDCEVYPDQFTKQIAWVPQASHQSSMATAMQWQTVKRRGRWLKPHPEKSVQWQALMHAKASIKSRPWIGLAWTGGNVGGHGWLTRNVRVEDLKLILDLPANFVSLEYRNHEEIPGIHQWPWATQTFDLDDFTALVDNLHAVVCVPTTAYHVAGGLGIPCHVIVHDTPHFHEGLEGDCPWWSSVKLHRKTHGLERVVQGIADELARNL